MRAPSLLIIASPYEAELLGRELAETGLRVLRADDGEGALALLVTELPIAVVVGAALTGADPAVIVAETRARHEGVSLFLLADPDDPIATELRPRVTTIFRRPTDFRALAHAIERIAVEVERADLAEVDALAPPPSGVPILIPRIPTQPFGDLLPVPPGPQVRGHRTEVLREQDGARRSRPSTGVRRDREDEGPIGVQAGAQAANLLRADDALGELANLGLDEMTRPGTPARPRPMSSRSTIAREIDHELSQAEQRLFPNESSSPPALLHGEDFDDPLSDIDLDSLAIDPTPALQRSLGIDERPHRSSRRQPATTEDEALSLRPVQEEGSLEAIDIAELLARLCANAFSGALKLSLAESEKIVYLDQGEPVAARSTLRHDQLGELLFREGKVTREQAQRARGEATADHEARSVALRLVEQGLLKDREVFSVLRRHAEEVLYSLFALESGRYELGPSLPTADERVRLSASGWALILEGIRRKYGLERLNARLGGRDVVLRPAASFARVVEAAGLSSEERRVVALLDGTRSLGEVRGAVGGRISESVVFALAWMLHAAGAVESGEGVVDLRQASTVVTQEEVSERRGRPRRADREQVAAEESVERERIASKRAQIADADYFAILGVGRDASEHELHRAHERLRADFDPARFSAEAASQHREALDEIREVLDEAARVLSNRGIRQRYAEHLAPLEEDRAAADTQEKQNA